MRINVLVDYKGGATLFNSSSQFICAQSPKACQEDQDQSVSLYRQARAVAK